MIFNRKTLEKFINLKGISNSKIIEILIDLGFETKIIQDFEKMNNGIVVAKVLGKNKVNNYDELNFWKVSDGKKIYSIICSDNNFKINDFIILAKAGAVLQKDWKINKRKFGECISEGMLCSYSDLGLPIKDEKNYVIVLNKNAILGDEKPFRFINFDDVVFEVESFSTYPISNSIFGILKFLSGVLNLKIKEFDKINFEEKKIIFNYLKEENKSIQCFYFKNNFEEKDIKWLEVFSNINNLKETKLIDRFINFINIFYNIKLKKIFLKDEPKKIEIINNKIIINNNELNNNDSKYSEWVLIIFSNLFEKDFYPTSQILNIAIKHFIFLINNEFNNIKIFADLKNYNFRKKQNFKISLKKINKLLGTKLNFFEIKNILEIFEFKVNLENEFLNILCPSWNKYLHENYVIEEIFRFLKCKNIEPKKFIKIPILNFKNKILNYKKELERFLLSIGIDQVKTYSLISKENFVFENKLNISNERKSKYLRSTLLSCLKNLDLKKNIFTIDKIFLEQNSKINEIMKLAILFNSDLYFDVISKSNIKINKLYLINLLGNILKLFNISESNLWQEISNEKKIFLEKKIKNTSFSEKGYEKIYWGNSFLGIIGEMNIKKGLIFKHSFYLEIDLNILFKIILDSKKEIKFKIKNKKLKESYRDYSIIFDEKFKPKIKVQFDEKKIIEINNFNHWINKIKSIDNKIIKVELMDIYKFEILTFRVWIDSENEKKIFEKIENELKNIKKIKK